MTSLERGDQLDDSKIIEMYFERNEIAIKETEKKYSRLLHKISKNILNDPLDVEECVNNAYLAIWNAIPPEKPKSLVAFISRIIRNISLKRYEYNSAEKRSSNYSISLHELEEVLPCDGGFNELSESELGKVINDFLSTEKEDARNVFMRKYWFFDSIEDICERYSFSESKVKSMLFNTRTRLKKYLEKKGIYV